MGTAGKMTMIDSNVTDVTGGGLGGVFGVSGGILDIRNSYFEKATANFMGALICGVGSATVITLRDSVARDIGKHGSFAWGDIALFDGPSITVSRTRFEACQKGIFYLALVSPPSPNTRPPTTWCLRMAFAPFSPCASSLFT